MTPRDNRATIFLGCVIGALAFAFIGYLFVYVPLSDKARLAEVLEAENAKKDLEVRQILKEMPRLQTSIKRSLPADQDVAKQEYDAAINRILRESKVPSSSFSVKPKSVDGKPAPELAPKKPAYSRVGLEVTMKKVTFATVLDVLTRYYKLNLLHQITKITMKKTEDKDSSAVRRGAPIADKPDLEVTFVTEAIILDGAEPRRSLLPVSPGMGAIGGGAGLQTVLNSPVQARGLTPLQLTQVLASNNRDYSLVLVKDFFHGPPPPPEPPVVVRPPDPKEDTSAFIRMTGIGRNSDGSGTAFIEDVASKQEYLIDVRWVKDKLTVEVVKSYYSIKGIKKSYAPEPELDISESTSGTAKKFRVIGFDGDALVLALIESTEVAPKPSTIPGGNRRPGGPGMGGPGFGAPSGPPAPGGVASKEPKVVPVKGEKPTKPDADIAAVKEPTERIFVWKSGEPLSRIIELKGTEKIKAIQRATAGGAGEATTLISNPVATQPIGTTGK